MFLLFWFIFIIHVVVVSVLPPLYLFGFFGSLEIIIFSLMLAYFIRYRDLDIRKRSFKLLGTLYMMEVAANILNTFILLALLEDFNYKGIVKMFSFNFVFGSVILVVLPIILIFIFSKLSDAFYNKLKHKRYPYIEILFTTLAVIASFYIFQKLPENQEREGKKPLFIKKNIFQSSYNNPDVEKKLKHNIWNYIAKYNKNQKENVRFFLAYYDFDSDGKDEAFVYLDSDGFCSNGSCRVVVFYLSETLGYEKKGYDWFKSAMLPMAKKELYIDINTTLVKEDWERPYGDIYTEVSRDAQKNLKYLHYTHERGKSKMVRYLKHGTKEFSEFETKMNDKKYFHKLEFKKFDTY